MRHNKKTREDYLELVDKIKHLPILQIFEQYIGGKLRHHGKKAMAQCPWHGRDSSPSLTLYIERGNWYCFGCQRGGTVIDLVMAALGVDFKAAVAAVARDFGLNGLQPDPEVRQRIKKTKERRDVETSFDADFERIFLVLTKRRSEISGQLKTYYDFEQNPDLVNDIAILDGILDEIVNARDQEAKVRAWRMAREVFPWLKTKTSK